MAQPTHRESHLYDRTSDRMMVPTCPPLCPPTSHRGNRRRTMHWFTPPRELLSGLSHYTSTGEGPDEKEPPMKPKTEMIEQTTQHRRKRLHRDRALLQGKSGLHHCKGPPLTTCNNKPRGKTHPVLRVPILQGEPSTGNDKTRSGSAIAQGVRHRPRQQ
ncbi:hypothetical protein CRG98_005074 [Punica granatum]|uniref:Uncharacterized protein n=1 Tax=Punica granatum TaxID=22663 RepID=A0A2I0L1E2_PUNGR|nr:hypothetical protein CRG98_005074 [Punica granatum]